MKGACIAVSVTGFLLAQLAWLVASLHWSTTNSASEKDPDCAFCSIESNSGLNVSRWTAFAVSLATLATAIACIRFDSRMLDYALAAMCMVSTIAVAVYSSFLRQAALVTKLGYGAALFSLASMLVVLASTFRGDEPPPKPREIAAPFADEVYFLSF